MDYSEQNSVELLRVISNECVIMKYFLSITLKVKHFNHSLIELFKMATSYWTSIEYFEKIAFEMNDFKHKFVQIC